MDQSGLSVESGDLPARGLISSLGEAGGTSSTQPNSCGHGNSSRPAQSIPTSDDCLDESVLGHAFTLLAAFEDDRTSGHTSWWNGEGVCSPDREGHIGLLCLNIRHYANDRTLLPSHCERLRLRSAEEHAAISRCMHNMTVSHPVECMDHSSSVFAPSSVLALSSMSVSPSVCVRSSSSSNLSQSAFARRPFKWNVDH